MSLLVVIATEAAGAVVVAHPGGRSLVFHSRSLFVVVNEGSGSRRKISGSLS